MIHPLQIEFHNTTPIEDVEFHIRREMAELEKFYHRIVSCRVDVEVPEHPRRGSVSKVHLKLLIPAKDVVLSSERRGSAPGEGDTEHLEVEAEHKDASLAAHEAFTTARRRLEEYTRHAVI